MKIPETIRINGIDFSIEMHENLDDGEKVLYGDISHGQTRIRLNSSNQSHQNMCVTMWHEIFHAIFTMNVMDLGNDEEKIIDKLAYAVYQILQDNGQKLFDIE